jgi:hypothetical protein
VNWSGNASDLLDEEAEALLELELEVFSKGVADMLHDVGKS